MLTSVRAVLGLAESGNSPADILAAILSASFSPYITLPAFSVWLVGRYAESPSQFATFLAVAVFFSTLVPLLSILYWMQRGRITDIHVMLREQRREPFFVGIVSSLVGTLVLLTLHAPEPIILLGVVLVANGLLFAAITQVWKVSIHVSVLSVAVLMSMLLLTVKAAWLFLLVPAVVWARVHRKRHNFLQGLGAVALACAVTLGILQVFGFLLPEGSGWH